MNCWLGYLGIGLLFSPYLLVGVYFFLRERSLKRHISELSLEEQIKVNNFLKSEFYKCAQCPKYNNFLSLFLSIFQIKLPEEKIDEQIELREKYSWLKAPNILGGIAIATILVCFGVIFFGWIFGYFL